MRMENRFAGEVMKAKRINKRLPEGNPLKAKRCADESPVLRFSAGAPMEYDREKVDEVVLAPLWLTAFDVDRYGARAWKSHDWDALDRLHAKGYISDPKSKAKSVVLSEEGMERARELFERHFGGKS